MIVVLHLSFDFGRVHIEVDEKRPK
jgi:hypothetical protein